MKANLFYFLGERGGNAKKKKKYPLKGEEKAKIKT